jgi:hypothetical protein
MATQEVVLARNNLAAAEAESENARREAARLEMERLSALGAELSVEYDRLARQVKGGERDRLVLHQQLYAVARKISFYSTPLDPMDFPTMAEKAYHASQLPLWEREHAALLVKFADAQRREEPRLECVKLANQIIQLRYSIRNLKNIALGREPGEVKGSINYYSGDNFLRSGGQLRRVVV